MEAAARFDHADVGLCRVTCRVSQRFDLSLEPEQPVLQLDEALLKVARCSLRAEREVDMGIEGVHDFGRLCLCRRWVSLDGRSAHRRHSHLGRLRLVLDRLDEFEGFLGAEKGAQKLNTINYQAHLA